MTDCGSQTNIKSALILCLLEVLITGTLKSELNKEDVKSLANTEGESLRPQLLKTKQNKTRDA